jgi:hypothetical protein
MHLVASGVAEFRAAADRTLVIQIGPSFRERFLPLVKYVAQKDKGLKFNLDLEAVVYIAETQHGGILTLELERDPIILLRQYEPISSRKQMDTLRGIERFIAWAQMGHKPQDSDCDEVHEAIVDAVMPVLKNKYNGKDYSKRTSDGNKRELSRCIEFALNWLATCDISDDIVIAMGKGMKQLWIEWYEWRYTQALDPLLEDEMEMSWDEYREVHQVCELCSLPDLDGDPLERMHIVSGGSNISAYEYPWNWLHAHRSHHINVQHQNGWGPIEKEYPHIIGKLNRAREMAESTRKDNVNSGSETTAMDPGSI